MESGAMITGPFRFALWRKWDSAKSHTMVWIMLNPSTADAMKDDPTIRRCIGFAKQNDCGGIAVVNLIPFKATNPKDLKGNENRCSTYNSMVVFRECKEDGRVVVAGWGNYGLMYPKITETILSGLKAHHIPVFRFGRVTSFGQPRHPLYLKKSLMLERHA